MAHPRPPSELHRLRRENADLRAARDEARTNARLLLKAFICESRPDDALQVAVERYPLTLVPVDDGAEYRACEDCDAAFACEKWSELTRCTACQFLYEKGQAEDALAEVRAARDRLHRELLQLADTPIHHVEDVRDLQNTLRAIAGALEGQA